MTQVILVIHVLIAVALIAVILLQRSEGGALGMGGGGGGFMTGRGTANLLTRSTAVLATLFIGTSLILAILAGNHSKQGSILDAPATSAPAQPEKPSVPVSQ